MSRGDAMLAYARAQLGKPYRLGAHGPARYDCSGLTMESAKTVGLIWYHGATTQWRRGLASGNPARYGYWLDTGTIDTLPADRFAVLFHADAKRSGVMAHTGLYDGAGRVVQAGGYGGPGVHEGPLDKRRWSHWATLREADDAPPAATTPTLRKGSAGEAVKMLQNALVGAGYPLEVDGRFGALTEAALMAYQKAKGLTTDGICGPLTWAKIRA